MTNQISSEALTLLYDNTQLFYVSNRVQNRIISAVSEPEIAYESSPQVGQKFAETVFVISKKSCDLVNPALKDFISKFMTSISRNDANTSIVYPEELGENIFEKLIADKNVKYVICWGIEDLLTAGLSKYDPVKQGGKFLLMTDSVNTIE